MADNVLYYGDNLDILRRYVADESVDLIYLDPPFNSNATYNVLFAERNGSQAAAQIKAFEDTWQWDSAAAQTFQETVEAGGKVSEALQAFHTFLGPSNMLAYLCMMAPRLLQLRRVLKPTGSIYLHCDPTASHYLKILMDAVFGPQNFRNEIIWRRAGSHNAKRSYGPVHDTIFFYSNSGEYTFRVVRRPYMSAHVEKRYSTGPDGRTRFSSGGNVLTGAGVTDGESCKPWRGYDPAKKGRHWAVPRFYEPLMPEKYRTLKPTEKLEALYKAGLVEIAPGSAWPTMVRYLDERGGSPLQDIWAYQPYTEGTVYGTPEGVDADVAWMGPTDPERLGYQTQKPVGLLERIVTASTNEGNVVLDPFCGCGTAVAVAQRLKRRWIGIDITHLAINLIKHRLHSTFGREVEYEVVGEPVSLPDARQLAAEDRFQFQSWALGLVYARPAELRSERGAKKGPDHGIDGRAYFHDEGPRGKTKVAILSVKSGNVTVKDVRDLGHVVTREKAAIGALLTLEEPTKPMRAEAAGAGFYDSRWGTRHPRLQILTVAELLAGKGIDMPPVRQVSETFKKAPRARHSGEKQNDLLGDSGVTPP